MTNWRKMPFVRIIIPFILGITIGIFWPYINPNVTLGCVFLLAFTLVILHFKQLSYSFRWVWGVLFNILIFSLGYFITYFYSELHDANYFGNYIDKTDNSTLLGIVTDYTEKENFHRITLSVQEIINDSTHRPANGNLLVYIKKDSLQQLPPQYGDVIVLASKINSIESPKNPDVFDFQKYWHFKNIHHQTFIEYDNFKILAHEQGNVIYSLALKWCAYFIAILKQHLTTPDEYAVGAALLLGEKDSISDEIRNAYIETGAMHILAISGMHLILIFGHFEKLLDKYATGNRKIRTVKTLIYIIGITLFTLITGLGASIVRAAVMAILNAISKRLNRPVHPFNTIAASALILLLYNPYWILDVGFQLSYAAVIGIRLFAGKISKIIASDYWLINKSWQNIAIGIAAQVAVTPLALYYFHQIPTYFWMTGLVAGFIADFAVQLGILLFLFNAIPIINWILGKLLFCLIWLLNNIILQIQKLPFTTLEIFGVTVALVFLFYIILSSLFYAFEKRKLRLLIYPLSITAILCCIYAFKNVKNEPQNEAIVYYLPRNTLIDIVSEKNCYSFYKNFSGKIPSENRINSIVSGHRNALNINNLIKLNFNEYIIKNNLLYHSGYMRLGAHSLLILDRLPKTVLTLNNCFVVVNGNPKFYIHDLIRLISIRQIIFDGSNSRSRVENWKKECEALGVAYHDVGEKGAWILNF